MKIVVIISIVASLYFPIVIHPNKAQETSTPAPTKTEQPTATISSENDESQLGIITPSTELTQPFTQVDLNVLVGNVQRPNAIAWFNDYLYVVCNGDWTIYEIESTMGATQTFLFGIRDTHTLHVEETEEGFNLWLPDFATNTLFKVDQSRSAPDVITQENLDSPWGITALQEDFLITNIRGDNIIRINRDGDLLASATGLRSPAGIVATEEHIFVVNNGSARRSIEWVSTESFTVEQSEPSIADADTEPVTLDLTFNPLVSGLQNTSNLVLATDGYLYFTYALGSRGVVGRISPTQCLEEGCTNDQVEIVLYTDLPAPLAGLTVTPDMRVFVHTIYRPELYWIDLNG